MTQDHNKFLKWKQLLTISESILIDIEKGSLQRKDIIDYLNTIEMCFMNSSDPVEDFEGYALVQFCKSIRQTINKTNTI